MTSFSRPGPGSTGYSATKPPAPDEWQSTRAQTALATQILRDEDEYLAPEKHDIGRLTGTDTRELFVSCAPAEAMQQQFEHLNPEFIAIHDVATASSRKLLAGVAAASSRTVQKLIIRRQGYGTALASLEFVELPTPDGSVLRLYSTEADADTAARSALARTLLAFSRLGVVMVGELPAHAIGAALQPLHDAMIRKPWPNRQLLLLPLASSSTLASHGSDLARGTGVNVRTTPQVTRPADAWGFISGTWNQLRTSGSPAPRHATAAAHPSSARAPERAAAPASAPLHTAQPGVHAAAVAANLAATPMRPMPTLGAAAPAPTSVLERYVHRLEGLAGMVSCCVFDTASGREISHAGASPSAADLGIHGAGLLAAMGTTSRALGFGHALPEAAITLGSHHLLLRAVPKNPGLALHAVLDKTHANLALARLQVARLDALFDEAD
ncbi:MAG: hypothetical protein ABIP61_07685 [Burkholderiaceae bacterium]